MDISCGYKYCLALSGEGLVYGWGDSRSHRDYNNTGHWKRFLSPVLINSDFGVETKVKHIQCCNETSVLVTFDGSVYVSFPRNFINNIKFKLVELIDIHKIYFVSKFDSEKIYFFKK